MIFALAALAQTVAEPPRSALPYPKANIINCAVTGDTESLLCRATQASRENRFVDSAGLFEQAAAKLAAGQAETAQIGQAIGTQGRHTRQSRQGRLQRGDTVSESVHAASATYLS